MSFFLPQHGTNRAVDPSLLKMTDHQRSNIFTPLDGAKLDILLAQAPDIARDNNCVFLGAGTTLAFEPCEDMARVGLVARDASGDPLVAKSNWGALDVMFIGKVGDMYMSPDFVFREPVMQGSEKQSVYVEAVEGNADSEAAVAQLLGAYTPEAWAKAVSECEGKHTLVSTMRKKNPTPDQVREHCEAMAGKGSVFLPRHKRPDDDEFRLKLHSKLVQSKKTHQPAKNGEFNTDIVNDYFEAHPESGLKLVEFMGRDGEMWEGKAGDIRDIGAAFFIVTFYPDYFAQKIGKVTCPLRLKTVVCISASTGTHGSKQFKMRNMQDMLVGAKRARPDDGDGDDDDDDDAESKASRH